METSLSITTGARLHFGLLAHAPRTGPAFGGVGLMIDSPGFRVSARRSVRDRIDAPDGPADRITEFVKRFRTSLPDTTHPPVTIQVSESIPPHAGLGSGTQLGLAIATLLSRLAGVTSVAAPERARLVGRGARSALGIHGFQQGGFLVEGGRTHCRPIGTLVARHEFPPQWRLLLITPPRETGLSGRAEREAFARLPGTPPELTGELCRLALMELLPAVAGGEFGACGEALYRFGALVGEYFAPIQGGTYASAAMRALVARLRADGTQGVGQTSWGPTLFVLLEDQAGAEQLADALKADDRWSDCTFRIAAALNRGASVTSEA